MGKDHYDQFLLEGCVLVRDGRGRNAGRARVAPVHGCVDDHHVGSQGRERVL